jgi:hypothetical protein
VPPQLTADERAEKEARERRAAEEKAAHLEVVRRDRLLLQRFPNQAAHDRARNSALEDMRAAMRVSDRRIADLMRERKPLTDEAEFYQGKTLPTTLKLQLDANDAALSAQRDAQTQQQAEMQRIAARFDLELAHLKEVWAGRTQGAAASTGDAPEPTRASRPAKPLASQSR